TWAGWFLNYEEQFILVVEDAQIENLTRKLMRIGLDNIYGYISGVNEMGIALQAVDTITTEEFKDLLNNNHIQVVDVRGATEFESGHVGGADHVFLGTLEDNLDKINKDKQVVIHCLAGD